MLKEVTVYTLFGSICYCYGAICNLPRNTYPHYDYDNDLHISMSPVLLVSNLFLVMITLTCVCICSSLYGFHRLCLHSLLAHVHGCYSLLFMSPSISVTVDSHLSLPTRCISITMGCLKFLMICVDYHCPHLWDI